jgi:hypothetical protein
MLIKWKEKEVDVQIASVKKAKLAVELAEAERDVARVSWLIEQNVASAQKYNFSDFKAKVDKKQKGYQKALSTETKETAEVKKTQGRAREDIQTVEVISSRCRLLLPPPEHVRNNFTFYERRGSYETSENLSSLRCSDRCSVECCFTSSKRSRCGPHRQRGFTGLEKDYRQWRYQSWRQSTF